MLLVYLASSAAYYRQYLSQTQALEPHSNRLSGTMYSRESTGTKPIVANSSHLSSQTNHNLTIIATRMNKILKKKIFLSETSAWPNSLFLAMKIAL